MAAILSLIGGVKGLVIIALVLALGAYIGVLHHEKSVAQEATKTAQAQAAQANADRDKAIKVAQDDAATIANLQQEKQNVNDALNTLQTAKNNNAASASTRQTIITSGAGIAANKATTAPVIGNMIQAVQSDRAVRRGVPDTQLSGTDPVATGSIRE